MINIYKYSFYRMYTWNLIKWGAEDVPEYKAMFIVSLFVSLNIITVGCLFQALGLVKVDFRHLSKPAYISLWLGVVTVLFLLFVYRDKYKIIQEEYKKETLKQRNINSVLVLLYMVASFFIYVFI